MKLVSRDIKAWMVKVISVLLVPSFLALPAYAQLMLAHEGHHDAGGCSIKTGEFPVTFSAYEIPEGDLPPMHSFCENLPNPGKVNLTIELPHEARNIPLAIRVIKEGHGVHDASKQGGSTADQKKVSDKDHAEHEGMDHDGSHVGDKHADSTHGAIEHGNYYLAPMIHNSGIIVIATNLAERAKYNILLEKDDGSGNMKTVVSIPLNVGKGGGHGSHGGGIGMIEIVLALLVVGGGGYYYFVYRKKATQASA